MKLLPERYYRGLTKTQKIKRHAEIRRFGAMSASNPRAYVGFQTDKGIRPTGIRNRHPQGAGF